MKDKLYILPQKEKNHVKIGITIDEHQRISTLEKTWGAFDVESKVITLKEGFKAKRLEKTLHGMFTVFNKGYEKGDGHTEFFDYAIFDKSIEYLKSELFSPMIESIKPYKKHTRKPRTKKETKKPNPSTIKYESSVKYTLQKTKKFYDLIDKIVIKGVSELKSSDTSIFGYYLEFEINNSDGFDVFNDLFKLIEGDNVSNITCIQHCVYTKKNRHMQGRFSFYACDDVDDSIKFINFFLGDKKELKFEKDGMFSYKINTESENKFDGLLKIPYAFKLNHLHPWFGDDLIFYKDIKAEFYDILTRKELFDFISLLKLAETEGCDKEIVVSSKELLPTQQVIYQWLFDSVELIIDYTDDHVYNIKFNKEAINGFLNGHGDPEKFVFMSDLFFPDIETGSLKQNIIDYIKVFNNNEELFERVNVIAKKLCKFKATTLQKIFNQIICVWVDDRLGDGSWVDVLEAVSRCSENKLEKRNYSIYG